MLSHSRSRSAELNDTPVEQPSTLSFRFNTTTIEMKNAIFSDKVNGPRQQNRTFHEGGSSSSPTQTKKSNTQDQPSITKRRVYVVTNADDNDVEPLVSEGHVAKGDDERGELAKSESETADFHSFTQSLTLTNQSSTLPRPNSGSNQKPEFEVPSLPVGWERRIDPESDKPYYVDHATRTTSWSSPTLTEVGRDDSTLGPLPDGWGMIPTKGGKTIFVDHKTRTTTWLDPRKSKVEETPTAQFIRKALYLDRVRRRETLPGCFEIKIRRSQILQDSYPLISKASLSDLKRTPKVMFEEDDRSQNRDAER